MIQATWEGQEWLRAVEHKHLDNMCFQDFPFPMEFAKRSINSKNGPILIF